MPRVISGRFRGFKLLAPKGEMTRPTADKVKEAVFSILISSGCSFEGAVILDAFAGSASLGIEALSRGASKAVFCDQSLTAIRCISHNLSLLKDSSLWKIYKQKWPMAIEPVSKDAPFNIIFLDPPYSNVQETADLLCDLAGIAAPGAWAVWEQKPASLKLWSPEHLYPWRLLKVQKWGDQAAAFFTLGA